jgi:hypothetical protein
LLYIQVLYNPANTSLCGASEVYLTGGFNRWKHPQSIAALKMAPSTANKGLFEVRYIPIEGQ